MIRAASGFVILAAAFGPYVALALFVVFVISFYVGE